MGAYQGTLFDLFCGACDPAADTEWDGTGQTVCGKHRRSAAGGWKEAVMYVCRMWEERSGMKKY